MKKLTLIFILIGFIGSAQIKKLNCNTTQTKVNGVFVNNEICDSVLYQPDWTGLQNDLFNSHLFTLAADSARPNYFSSLLKTFEGRSTPQTFLYLLIKCQIPFSQTQKDEINGILTKNYFAIQL